MDQVVLLLTVGTEDGENVTREYVDLWLRRGIFAKSDSFRMHEVFDKSDGPSFVIIVSNEEDLRRLRDLKSKLKIGDFLATISPLSTMDLPDLTDDDVTALNMLVLRSSGIEFKRCKDSPTAVSIRASFWQSAVSEIRAALQDLRKAKQADGKKATTSGAKLLNPFTAEADLRASYRKSGNDVVMASQPVIVEPVKSQPVVVDDCPICMTEMDESETTSKLLCGHAMHKGCHDEFRKSRFYKCPRCQKVIAEPRGIQPGGTMHVTTKGYKLRGHEYDSSGTIEIFYNFPDGRQGEEHSNPGQRYSGTSRIAYLPSSVDGERVLRLLRKAFDARLLFTIDRSVTTGSENCVVWNNIHHKTQQSGEHGYPDATYLKRVTEELAAVGITEGDWRDQYK